MGNQLKSVQKGDKVKNNKPLPSSQLLPPLPDMYIPLQDHPQILEHPSQTCLKIYTILINRSSDQIKTYKQSLKFRQQHPQLLIQVLYGSLLKNQEQYSKIKVYIENINCTLQQFRNIHYFDLMAIFYWAFKGFQQLFLQFGAFQVDPRMIGFIENSRVKVWCNIKYSKPTPKTAYQIMDQTKMVHDLIQIFMNKIDLSSIPIDSHKRKFKLQANTFQEIIKLIENQVDSIQLIPRQIHSIKNLMVSGRKIDPNVVISMNSQIYLKDLDKIVKFNYSNPTEDTGKQKQKVNFTYSGNHDYGRTQKSLSCPKPNIKFTVSNNPGTKFPPLPPSPNKQSRPKIIFTANNNKQRHSSVSSMEMQQNNEKSRISTNHPQQESAKNQSSRISETNSSRIKNSPRSQSASRIKFTYN